jgi:hypothetical protein
MIRIERKMEKTRLYALSSGFSLLSVAFGTLSPFHQGT